MPVSSASPFSRLALFFLVVLGCSGTLQAQLRTASSSPSRPHDPLTTAGFDHFYNLEFDRAVDDFQRVLVKHPDDPFAINHVLTAVLFRELYRIGALNTGEYTNNSFINAPHHEADTAVKAQIKALVGRALAAEQTRLHNDPKDVDALYARGVTRAQFATYTALVEHAWFSALRNAVGARRDHEKVLELSPDYVDAKLVVGAHNYVLGTLPWGVKVAASLVGFSGNKQKGIAYLKEAAAGNGEASTDSKIVLILFLRREGRFEEALQIAGQLVDDFPRSSLLKLEEGNLLRAVGKPAEAAAIYRQIWDSGRAGHYPAQKYQTAAIALGDLLRNQKDYPGALAAYEMLNSLPEADPDLKQKASLQAGEIYDLLKQRDMAVRKYQEVITLNASNEQADSARRLMKTAYRE
ncbi:MAG TPA: tetratricopeptide repeat protein [Terriglobales bacterium]|nr:tetratricopeptide repeat protein [Terriglobales bacterium]